MCHLGGRKYVKFLNGTSSIYLVIYMGIQEIIINSDRDTKCITCVLIMLIYFKLIHVISVFIFVNYICILYGLFFKKMWQNSYILRFGGAYFVSIL